MFDITALLILTHNVNHPNNIALVSSEMLGVLWVDVPHDIYPGDL